MRGIVSDTQVHLSVNAVLPSAAKTPKKELVLTAKTVLSAMVAMERGKACDTYRPRTSVKFRR